MTRLDTMWRMAGLALTIGSCAASLCAPEGSPVVLPCFLAALGGLVLMLNGKRVGVVLKAERRGHQGTAAAIHARRVRGRHPNPRV